MIRIDRIDEEKSKPSSSQPHYVAILSGKLDQTEINNLSSLIQRGRNTDIMNVDVKLNPGNVLTFDTRAGVELAAAVSTIQGWLGELGSKEEQFKEKIKEVNEKLSSRKDLDQP